MRGSTSPHLFPENAYHATSMAEGVQIVGRMLSLATKATFRERNRGQGTVKPMEFSGKTALLKGRE